MKGRKFLATIVLLGMVLISGCTGNLTKWIPFAKPKTVSETSTVQKVEAPKSREELAKEVDAMTDDMVKSINNGNWNQAITVGEQAYSTITGSAAQAIVKNSVYALDSTKEKLFETLVEAYDYKTHLEGLSTEEKQKYIRAARAHYNINPTEPFKKLSLAKVLVDNGDYPQGLRLTTEIYNSPQRNKDVTEQYAWVLYLSGRKAEAYNIYKTFYPQAETLAQLYHSAIVIEEQNKLLGLILYKACIMAGNNLMVLEPNVNNLSAESYINSIISDSQRAFDRLMAGGMRIDSQYNLETVESLVKSIVKLSGK